MFRTAESAQLAEWSNRYEGAMFGLAIGDALGWPVEFLSPDAISGQYGPDGTTDLEPSRKHPAGTFADDTPMSLAIALAAEACGRDKRVRFCRVTELIIQLMEVREGRELGRLKRQLNRLDLLLPDELGYVPARRLGTRRSST
jgi:ADP-ribosylglycohydrolase